MFKNRIVIIGETIADAHEVARSARFRDEISSPVIVSASGHPTTIRGSLAGMHVGSVYITPRARDAERFELVQEALDHCGEKNPAMKTIVLRQEALA